jgi:hypothetical protein
MSGTEHLLFPSPWWWFLPCCSCVSLVNPLSPQLISESRDTDSANWSTNSIYKSRTKKKGNPRKK